MLFIDENGGGPRVALRERLLKAGTECRCSRLPPALSCFRSVCLDVQAPAPLRRFYVRQIAITDRLGQRRVDRSS